MKPNVGLQENSKFLILSWSIAHICHPPFIYIYIYIYIYVYMGSVWPGDSLILPLSFTGWLIVDVTLPLETFNVNFLPLQDELLKLKEDLKYARESKAILEVKMQEQQDNLELLNHELMTTKKEAYEFKQNIVS